MLQTNLHSDGRLLTIARNGAALVTQQCPQDARPFIHPLMPPDGIGVLTEDRPGHHPWQHGLYIGLNDVNGHGFWSEGLSKSPTARDGTFHPTAIQLAPGVSESQAGWQFDCLYRGHEGQPLLTETQAWTFRDLGEETCLDLTWSLRGEADVRFGKYAYGGLFLRMPFRDGCEGQVLSSEGAASAPEAEQKRARWVAVSMLVLERMGLQADARRATVAIMDHPSNPEHPAPWRVDHQLGIVPSRCIAGPWTLARGEVATSRYRVLIRVGGADAGKIEASFANFAGRA